MEKIFKDQMNRIIRLEKTPERIISLVPSQTELLFDLGLEEKIVGITKFCIHPDILFRSGTRIGGTKTIDFEKIRSLKPDLIIGNKEENEKSQIEELEKNFQVWMSDIHTLEESIGMICSIGEITETQQKAAEISQSILDNFTRIIPDIKNRNVIYFIWKDPWMTAGSNTFIDDMLQKCGFENIIKEKSYPELSLEYLHELNPDIVFLSSEPFPFGEKHIAELQSFIPGAKIILVDGELFSWYGSRLIHSPDYFNQVINQTENI